MYAVANLITRKIKTLASQNQTHACHGLRGRNAGIIFRMQGAIKSKPNMIIYNPAFSMTKEQLEATIPEWPGYAAGFKRTACWYCPFQCREQYDALRINYPLLFEEMKRIMGSIRIKNYGVKSYDEKYKYWEKEGVKLLWDRNRKKLEDSSSSVPASSENAVDGMDESTTHQQPES